MPQPAITCSKVTIETLEQDVKYIWTYFTLCSSFPIVTSEQVNAGWGTINAATMFNGEDSKFQILVLLWFQILVLLSFMHVNKEHWALLT